MEQYFRVRIVKAMKQRSDEYLIRTNKIDSKTLIIFGDSKNPDDYYFGKDYLNLKSFEPIAVEVNLLMGLLGKPQITNIEAEIHGKFNIYQLVRVKDRNGEIRTVGHYTRNVPGDYDGEINLGVYKTPDWSIEDWSRSQLFWLPSSNLIDNRYICTKTESCTYTTKQKRDMDKHEKGCTDIQQIITKQVPFGSDIDEVAKLSKFLNIDFSRFRQEEFCCFDIETFSKGQVCTPVSIAVASTLDEPKYFEKADDTPEAAYQMVAEFMDYLMELQQMLLDKLEPEIQHAIEYLQAQKDELNEGLPPDYQSKFEFYQIYGYFKNYEALKTFGFNSR